MNKNPIPGLGYYLLPIGTLYWVDESYYVRLVDESIGSSSGGSYYPNALAMSIGSNQVCVPGKGYLIRTRTETVREAASRVAKDKAALAALRPASKGFDPADWRDPVNDIKRNR